MKLKNITKKFGNKKILDNVSVEFQYTGLNVISGISGIGKSTLLNIMGGFDSEYEGMVLSNYEVSYSRQEISLIENLTFKENIQLMNRFKEIDISTVKKFGIEEVLDVKICDMSGGQKARCELFNSYISDSEIILIDEPTANLDMDSSIKIIKIIKEMSKNRIIVAVSHDKKLINQADIVYTIKEKKLLKIRGLEGTKKPNRVKMTTKFKFMKTFNLIVKNDLLFYISEFMVLSLYILIFSIASITMLKIMGSEYSNIIGPYSEETIRVKYDISEEEFDFNKLNYLYDFNEKILKDNRDIEKAFLISDGEEKFTNNFGEELNLVSEDVTFEFMRLPIDPEYLSYYNPYEIDISDQKIMEDEVIIPLSLCEFYEIKCDTIIGSSISFPVSGEKERKVDYTVVDTYDQKKDSSDISFVYIPNELPELSSPEVISLLDESNNNTTYAENILFKELNSFEQNLRNGSGSVMLISEKDKMDSNIKRINSQCDKCIIETNRSIREENKKIIVTIVLIILLCASVFIIILVTLYNLSFATFINKRQKLKVKMSLMHYKKSEIRKLLFVEILFRFLFSSALSIVYIILLEKSSTFFLKYIIISISMCIVYYFVKDNNILRSKKWAQILANN